MNLSLPNPKIWIKGRFYGVSFFYCLVVCIHKCITIHDYVSVVWEGETLTCTGITNLVIPNYRSACRVIPLDNPSVMIYKTLGYLANEKDHISFDISTVS